MTLVPYLPCRETVCEYSKGEGGWVEGETVWVCTITLNTYLSREGTLVTALIGCRVWQGMHAIRGKDNHIHLDSLEMIPKPSQSSKRVLDFGLQSSTSFVHTSRKTSYTFIRLQKVSFIFLCIVIPQRNNQLYTYLACESRPLCFHSYAT